MVLRFVESIHVLLTFDELLDNCTLMQSVQQNTIFFFSFPCIWNPLKLVPTNNIVLMASLLALQTTNTLEMRLVRLMSV